MNREDIGATSWIAVFVISSPPRSSCKRRPQGCLTNPRMKAKPSALVDPSRTLLLILLESEALALSQGEDL